MNWFVPNTWIAYATFMEQRVAHSAGALSLHESQSDERQNPEDPWRLIHQCKGQLLRSLAVALCLLACFLFQKAEVLVTMPSL